MMLDHADTSAHIDLRNSLNIHGGSDMIKGGLELSRARGAKAQKRMTLVEQDVNNISFFPSQHNSNRTVELRPKSINQERLVVNLLDENTPIVVTVGPAGTGKTYLTMLAAIRALRSRQVDRLILTRPAVGVEDEKHGFLPGNLVSKMEPWTRPLFDVLQEYYHQRDITRMIEDQIIEISPLAYMRGRTFKRSWIIADEMQNATPAQFKMLLTRIGEDSKITVTGDTEQADRNIQTNGLLDLCRRLSSEKVNGLTLIEMGTRDIRRHPIISDILKLYS
jgi:phosphate starvation-inducible PhoH-like protein